jgi:hypothetical protein
MKSRFNDSHKAVSAKSNLSKTPGKVPGVFIKSH